MRAARRCFVLAAAAVTALLAFASPARADAVETLRAFVREVKSGRATFTQTVTSPDGVKKRASSGTFEFARPDRFRFAYAKPFEQLIVGDGAKVWIYDADLNQASSRRMSAALGATPAALLAGDSLDRDFTLAPLAAQDGVEWAEAKPKQKDAQFQSLRVGFRAGRLAAVEIVDAFGQKSALAFEAFEANARVVPETFRFVPPKGVDVIEQ
jgi:outer membrane lipoprotein carrier protein